MKPAEKRETTRYNIGNRFADLYGLIILIDNYNVPEEGLCFF